MGAIFKAEMRVDFESNNISLQGVVNLEDGWRIHSVFHPVVRNILCTLLLRTFVYVL